MTFRQVTVPDWRAQVEKELAGASFDETLVETTPEGLSIQPLYTEAPGDAFSVTDPRGTPVRICMRHEAGATHEALAEDAAGGADALWVPVRDEEELEAALGAIDPTRTSLVLETDGPPTDAMLDALAPHVDLSFLLLFDGAADLAGLGRVANVVHERCQLGAPATVSTLRYHDAGADAADEIALALSTGAAYLDALLGAGLSPGGAARRIAMQVAVGRDTFVELAKLRALRVAWQKLLTAAGVTDIPRTQVHAVCSSRTLTRRDAAVNVLRVTTQVFAAALGGAELVTPVEYDRALGTPQALAHRIARNTCLVVRDESHLGRVLDPAGGSYYLESLTDALAREAWRRFQDIEREGGIVSALSSGWVASRLEASWQKRLALLEKHELPIVGVTDFANAEEKLPPAPDAASRSADGAFAVHRDAESFERAEKLA